MNRLIIVVVFAAAILGTVFIHGTAAAEAAAQQVPERAAELANAEREFAAAGARDGVQKSFLAHFADDSVVLRPFATPALAWYRAHPDKPGKLIWGPQYVAVSADANLGLSSGPWRYEGDRDGKPVTGHGHFFSIWRRAESGRWQVVIDHGIGHDAATVTVEETPLVALAIPAGKAPAAANAKAREQALADADDALRGRLAKIGDGAYAQVASEQTLWLRDGSMPARGVAPPATEAGKRACGCGARVKIGIAGSGDLGYTIGGREDARPQGTDIRVWSYAERGGWKLVADVASAVD